MRIDFLILIVAVAFNGIICADTVSQPDPLTLYKGVLSEQNKHKEKLNCVHLVWDRLCKEDGFVKNRKMETKGEYSLWWDGAKTATKFMQDYISNDGSGGYEITRSGLHTAFDGKGFRIIMNEENPNNIALKNEPKYDPGSNWFDLIRWNDRQDFLETLKNPRIYKGMYFDSEVSTVESIDGKLIRFTLLEKDKGLKTIHEFNASKGYWLVKEESFTNNKLRSRSHFEIKEVKDGFWCPTKLDTAAYDLQTGKMMLNNIYELDLEKSSFNEISDIPEEVFDIPIERGMEVSNYRGGVRIDYDLDISPYATEVLENTLNEFLENDTEVALAETTTGNGDFSLYAERKKHARNKPTGEIQTDEQNVLEVQTVTKKIWMVVVISGILVVLIAVFFGTRNLGGLQMTDI